MSKTFYFYDLETSSASPKSGRIMQFAGQRTDDNLKPIGEPDDILVKLADDVVPEPDAILIHGITPQRTLSEGITERDLVQYFHEKIAQPGTVFVGYNNIRFDDEFMRHLFYRNLYEPYEWHWKEGRSRWDLLDAMRMMRALRPDGIKWPFLEDKPTVKLELLAKENNFNHENAHDALSDVKALIQVAQVFKESQPKLFDFLLEARNKKSVSKLVEAGDPFVYTSGKYSSDFLKTTVVMSLFKHPQRDGMIVYDLRHDPEEWLRMSPEKLAKHWKFKYGEDIIPLPVKTLQYNRCPAVAPLSVIDSESAKRIGYDAKKVQENSQKIIESKEFINNLKKALDILENTQQATLIEAPSVDQQLYDEFWTDKDRTELMEVRALPPENLSGIIEKVSNKRIRSLIPLYKSRNFPQYMSPEEYEAWEKYRIQQLLGGGTSSRIAKCFNRMSEIASSRKLTENEKYLLSELQLYVESILPEPE